MNCSSVVGNSIGEGSYFLNNVRVVWSCPRIFPMDIRFFVTMENTVIPNVPKMSPGEEKQLSDLICSDIELRSDVCIPKNRRNLDIRVLEDVRISAQPISVPPEQGTSGVNARDFRKNIGSDTESESDDIPSVEADSKHESEKSLSVGSDSRNAISFMDFVNSVLENDQIESIE